MSRKTEQLKAALDTAIGPMDTEIEVVAACMPGDQTAVLVRLDFAIPMAHARRLQNRVQALFEDEFDVDGGWDVTEEATE